MTDLNYKFVVRLSTRMKDQIALAAKHYRRSMNSEIIARLEQSYGMLPTQEVEEAVQPAFHKDLEAIFRNQLSEAEQGLIQSFRLLGEDKQRALLSLLRD
ncbi:MAG: Arc family DNA-binding protein [Pseudomonadota bacterium]